MWFYVRAFRVRVVLLFVVALSVCWMCEPFTGRSFVRRSRIPSRKSRKSFSRGAQKVHRKNFQSASPMRGGIRL